MRHHHCLPLVPPLVALTVLAACSGGSSAPAARVFDAPQRFSVGFQSASELLLADIDRDGMIDALVGSDFASEFSVLRGVTGARFAAPSQIAGPPASDSLAAGDFDGDQLVDVAVGSSMAEDIGLFLNRGSGNLQQVMTVAAGTPVRDLAIADFSGDSRVDMVASSATEGRVVLLWQGVAGSFIVGSVDLPALPGDLVAGDFDGDGRTDLVTAAAMGLSVMTLLSDGVGGLADPTVTDVAQQSGELANGDMDADGQLDLVLVRADRSVLDVVLGDGTGSFMSAGQVQFPTAVGGVAVGDLDLDGDLDIAATVATSVFAVFNRGNAVFDSPVLLQTDAAGGGALAFQDMDANGIADLVYVSGRDHIAVLRNPKAVPIGLEPYGTGTPGCRGTIAMLANSSPVVGNSGFALTCSSVPGEALGVLILGGPADVAGSDPFGLGFKVHLGFDLVISRIEVADALGYMYSPEPIPALSGIVGLPVFGQTLWLGDAANSCSTSPFGVVTSRGLKFTIQAGTP